jgi:hypothetical protein
MFITDNFSVTEMKNTNKGSNFELFTTSSWTGFKLATLVVSSCNSNYHTITTTSATILQFNNEKRIWNHMKNKKYHTVGIFPKSIREIVEQIMLMTDFLCSSLTTSQWLKWRTPIKVVILNFSLKFGPIKLA